MPYYDEYFHEIEAQVLRFIEVAGKKPAYLEGHAVGTDSSEQAVKDVASKYGIIAFGAYDKENRFGLYRASLGQYAVDIFSSNNLYDQFFSDPEQAILNDEYGILDHDLAQIFFHPGFVDADIVDWSSFTGVRIRDVQALCSPRVKQWIIDNNIELINYYELEKLA